MTADEQTPPCIEPAMPRRHRRGAADFDAAARSLRPRSILLALVALLLVWQVVTTSLAAYLAGAAPQAAIWLQSDNAVALLNLAEKQLERQQAAAEPLTTGTADHDGARRTAFDVREYGLRGTRNTPDLDDAGETEAALDPAGGVGPPRHDPTRDAARASAERALLNDPLNARAFRILGQIAQAEADQERTEQLMQAATDRSLRESAAAYWMMQESYEKEDFRTALRHADTLLRTRPQIIDEIMPTLVRIAEQRDGILELERLLAGNPPWRSRFFEVLPARISDARTPLHLLLSLKGTPTPATTADLRPYLDFLIRHKLHELAYYVWLQFLPPEQLKRVGFLNNGSFENSPSGLPFDWVISPGSAVTIDIAARPDQDQKRALFIEFGHGRVDFRDVTQLIMLGPGSYRLHGRYQGEVVGRRGLQWRVTCADATQTRVGESTIFNGLAPTWQDFSVSFTVPDSGCHAQYLRLALDARSASEQFVSGSIWYDELSIVPDERP